MSTDAKEPADASDEREYIVIGDFSDMPGLVPLFESSPHGVLAAIAAGAAFIGCGTLGLEVMFSWMTRSEPVGHLAGVGFPFVSAPLGIAPVFMGCLLLYSRPRMALVPLLCGAAYWALVWWLWPT
jgi:hypothetical protein